MLADLYREIKYAEYLEESLEEYYLQVIGIISEELEDLGETPQKDGKLTYGWVYSRSTFRSKICEKFGGGGHPKACGFTIHGSGSPIWQKADSDQRKNLAFGERGLHSYFVIHG